MSAIQNWKKENGGPLYIEFYQGVIDRLGIDPYKWNEAPFLLFRGESKRYDKPNRNSWDRGEREFTKDQEIDYTEKVFKSIYHLSEPFRSELNLQFLAFIQHYGFRTRLLDYSSDEIIALWYAVKDDEEEAGYLHVACGFNILAFADNIDYADIESILYNPEFITNGPIGVLSHNPCLFYQNNNKYNLRAIRQKGWFLIQRKGAMGSEQYVQTYKINPEHKESIRREIEKSSGNYQGKILEALSKEGKSRFEDFLMANPQYIKDEFDAIQWSPSEFYIKTKEQVIETYVKISKKLGLTGQEQDQDFFEKLKMKGLEDMSISTMMTLRNTIRFNEIWEDVEYRETFRETVRRLAEEVLYKSLG